MVPDGWLLGDIGDIFGCERLRAPTKKLWAWIIIAFETDPTRVKCVRQGNLWQQFLDKKEINMYYNR